MKIRIFFLPAMSVMFALNCGASGFTEEEVTVFNRVDSLKLAGTLTYPDGVAPKALVVMATGSGLQNRDEEVFGHKPFKVIAEELSKEGYAVLRMDDRGFGESEGKELIATSTVDDFVTDITSGLDFVRNRFAGIKAGVIGHSEGGTIAIKIASQYPEKCGFIVTLAAPAWSGDSIIMSQSRAISTQLTGRWDGEQTQRQLLDMVKSPIPTQLKRLSIYSTVANLLGDQAKLPEVQQSLAAQTEVMVTPYYIEMISYDPAMDISQIKQPWLALNGDKDLQVLPENLQSIQTLNQEATTLLLPGHNHLFQHCTTGLVQEYPTITEEISKETVEAILSFLESLQL